MNIQIDLYQKSIYVGTVKYPSSYLHKGGPVRFESIPRRCWMLFVAICLLGTGTTTTGQTKRLATSEAKDHIGELATVCGKVASTRYASGTRGKPTFLNLDKPYPNPIFTVLIWGTSRDKFGVPEEKYRDKQICVTGKITEYRGAPGIVLADPENVEIEK